MAEEYKPGFKAWLFSVIIAAGFGSLLADGIRYLVNESKKTDAKLEFRDRQCRKEGSRIVCNYYFENIGDELTYITDVIVDGNDHPVFFTNSPIEVYSSDTDNPIKRAHVAIAEPHKMLMIGIALVDTEIEPMKICLKSGDKEITCIQQQ